LFDLLKNKFKSFTDKLFGKAKEKAEEDKATIQESESVIETKQETTLPQEPQISTPEVAESKSIKELTEEAEALEKTLDEPIQKDTLILGQPEVSISEPIIEKPILKGEPKLEKESVAREPSKTGSKHSIFEIFKPKQKVQPPVVEKPLPKIEERPIPTPKAEVRPTPVEPAKPVVERPIPKEEPTPKQLPTDTQEDLTVKKSTEIKKSLVTSIKSIFTSKIKLSEKEISDFLQEFELSLLEADVSIVSAENICKDLKEKLVAASFSKENPLEDIKEHIRESLKTQLDIDCDINKYIEKTRKADSPFVIMFIGPNGAGKTTTISKFAYHYKQEGKSVVLASGDTFRAGSIDQLEKHASAIGVKIVKQNYGSDPAAVAFDAVTSAKAGKIDYVFIDTAGRQENNINLMQELKKIKKVVNPNLTIYIGEAQAGQAIVDQVSGFEKEIGVDGVILTKLDTDPKGGVAISILNELKKPIFYVGTGQTYDDLESFSPQFIIDRVVI
jgi:fused signal recognition particle receptor